MSVHNLTLPRIFPAVLLNLHPCGVVDFPQSFGELQVGDSLCGKTFCFQMSFLTQVATRRVNKKAWRFKKC